MALEVIIGEEGVHPGNMSRVLDEVKTTLNQTSRTHLRKTALSRRPKELEEVKPILTTKSFDNLRKAPGALKNLELAKILQSPRRGQDHTQPDIAHTPAEDGTVPEAEGAGKDAPEVLPYKHLLHI
ncbi:hypothetical protein QAD02_010295 [Eretmocerus hayati]|uniref:Uncharacterized protein n=1 Tax=Eretmocerus hayati TaxID=131215 RepID=A0ACC2NC44_9HYME|nr:hypothetical protein QAD02_010295 [Eretmocerus hayati]